MIPWGSWRSRPSATRKVCGNLKSLSKYTGLARGRVGAPPPVQAVGWSARAAPGKAGTLAPVQVSVTVSRPVPTYALESQTYAGRPVKMPTPPRTTVVPLPSASTLKPSRGDQSTLPLGKTPVSMCRAASPGLLIRFGLLTGDLKYGTSARMPAVTVARSLRLHWSWMNAPSCLTEKSVSYTHLTLPTSDLV